MLILEFHSRHVRTLYMYIIKSDNDVISLEETEKVFLYTVYICAVIQPIGGRIFRLL